MKDAIIVEYEPKYAKSIANMWNNSIEGWNGMKAISIISEEEILKLEAQSDNLKLFLALVDDNVVGYCGFAEYQEDEGALYIPSLNVRDDCQGKGYGKKLVLRAVEEAIKMKWPRLDLYTWPGNTKAIPLYKKTGFFWEPKDNTTHLMNFLPTVMQTEAVKDFFKECDWYKENTRTIETKPDGIKSDNTYYFTYSWESNGKKLNMEFEQLSRGLCSIETDDYYIKSYLKKQKLVFGKDYKIIYDIKNKSGKELKIKLLGIDDKNIKYNAQKEVIVKDSTVIEEAFYVGKVSEKPNKWKTQPSVVTKIEINGQKALFKNGILTSFPISIRARQTKKYSCNLNKESEFVLNVENNFDESAEAIIKLPEKNDFINLKQTEFKINLTAKEKASIKIPYILNDFGFYNEILNISVKLKSGESINFNKEIGIAFPGITAMFTGKDDNYYYVYNGLNWLSVIYTSESWLDIYHSDKITHFFALFPMIGKPFSAEFSKIRPELCETYHKKDGGIGIKLKFKSNDFKGIFVYYYITLYQNGLFNYYYEIFNSSEEDISKDIHLLARFRNDGKPTVALKNGIVECKGQINNDSEFWNKKDFAENWIFYNQKNAYSGICWENGEFSIADWYYNLEFNLGKIEANKTVKTSKIWGFTNTFNNYHQFREFALGKDIKEKPITHDGVEIVINDGNPFINDNIDLVVKSNKSNMAFIGDIKLDSLNKSINEKMMHFEKEQEITEASFDFKINNSNENSFKESDVIKSIISYPSYDLKLESGIFRKGNTEIKTENSKEHNFNILQADNGIVSIKAAPDYIGRIISMKYKGDEWMDTDFPVYSQKAWWNPFIGGHGSRPTSFSNSSIIKEKAIGEFVTKKDNKGNVWTGIKLHYKIKEHEDYKNLVWNTYSLMLPDSPVIAIFTEMTNETGHFFRKSWGIADFFNPYDDLENCYYTYDENGSIQDKIKVANSSNELVGDSFCRIGNSNKDTKLSIIFNPAELHSDISNIAIKTILVYYHWKCIVPAGEKINSPVIFYAFHNENYSPQALKSLTNIRFD